MNRLDGVDEQAIASKLKRNGAAVAVPHGLTQAKLQEGIHNTERIKRAGFAEASVSLIHCLGLAKFCSDMSSGVVESMSQPKQRNSKMRTDEEREQQSDSTELVCTCNNQRDAEIIWKTLRERKHKARKRKRKSTEAYCKKKMQK